MLSGKRIDLDNVLMNVVLPAFVTAFTIAKESGADVRNAFYSSLKEKNESFSLDKAA